MPTRLPCSAAYSCVRLFLALLQALTMLAPACSDDSAPTSDAGSMEDAQTPRDAQQDAASDAGSRDAATARADAETMDHVDAGRGQDAATTQPSVTRSEVEADTTPAIDDATYAQLLSHLNLFGLDLGRAMLAENELSDANSVYSPLSASIALSMTYAGARADTAVEMKQVLSGDMDAETYHAGINRLTRELASRAMNGVDAAGNPRRIELNIADAVYVHEGLRLQSEFLDQLAKNYDSGVHREDFVNAFEPARMRINDWVAMQTHDKIQNLLPEGSITDLTRLVLVNALYFYGSWNVPFSPEATKDADFHTLAGDTASVATMHGRFGLAYGTGEGFAAVELPYVGNKLRMTVVLPDAGKLAQVRGEVSETWLKNLAESLETKTVDLAMPKFKMTVGSFNLTDSLKALGMKQAFSDTADFTGISSDEPLMITSVLQKAFIAVDENGTEAAAATAVSVGTTSVPVDVIDLKLDRPFLFFIRDDSGAVLFSGQVVDPS